ncbi:MAG TPA: SAM-dependent methyltransferase [Pseudonocardiaceae bacterium]
MTSTGIAVGVARTALMVAAARAMETHRVDSLARDEFAEHFVRAAPASADWPVRIEDAPGGDTNPLWGRLGRYFGVRTRVLDDRIADSVRAGARQVVLLGAGLDTRAFRLDLPRGTVVYELDRPDVLAFKRSVLDALGARPKATSRWIAMDLREDWASALLAAGFSPAAPTMWLAEGLLLYLPAAAERRLMATIDRLTGGVGTLAFEVKLGVESAAVRDSPIYTTAKQQIGVDMIGLFDHETRPDSAGDLRARDWSVTVHSPFEFARSFSTALRPERVDALTANRWTFATKG